MARLLWVVGALTMIGAGCGLPTNGTPDDPRAELRVDAAAVSGQWRTDWSRATVPLGEFAAGVFVRDSRDRIPPIDAPVFETVEAAAEWLQPSEPGALVRVDEHVRFYPLSILTRHEIVNDRLGDLAIAVTFCPLCNTAITFDRTVDGEILRLGNSGLLRKSDLVMWDDRTESLWQQITGEAVVGRRAGTRLLTIPTTIVAFSDFATTHPSGTSLSRDTGFEALYGANPYTGYSSLDAPLLQFYADEVDDRLPALERVVGLGADDSAVAYPFPILEVEGAVNTEVDGTPVAVLWGGSTVDALDETRISDSRRIGSGVAYLREVDGRVLTLSAKGDDTFVDVETDTTWNLLGLAVGGELIGTQLTIAPHRNDFWFAFSGFFPEGEVYGGQSAAVEPPSLPVEAGE